MGTKRSVLTDQRGAPLAVEVTGANTHDKTVALATLDSIVVERPEKVVYRLHHLCLDKGYDYADVIEGVEERDYHLHVAKFTSNSLPLKSRGKMLPCKALHSSSNNGKCGLVNCAMRSNFPGR